ncbi:oligopeptidase A [Sinobacterium caligoides]|uniref:oligopeptidase A n=1 Tax=Sinobacterium caligoides TaxID=933926 RepID=A0A3N2DHW4_9GAMM|nr:oligopeptidase A [Sinobacterium caligoides]ROR98984.1 oligopeptidase A [Sinobacterium caligoides]
MNKLSLPVFSAIEIEKIVPELEQRLADSRKAIEVLLSQPAPYSWQNLAEPMEAIDEALSQFWAPISHLNGVQNSDAMRDAYNASLPLLTAYTTELGQNRALCDAYQSIAGSDEYAQLSTAQRKAIDNALRDFKLSGVALDDAEQALYADYQQKLSELSTKYANNVLDATEGWHCHVTEEDELAGVPEMVKQMYAEQAAAKDLSGWLITLEIPSYLPLMQYADNRALREQMYTAFTTRASDQGPTAGQWDNSALMDEILVLRSKQAKLLGFNNYAECSLATKMAETPAQVVEFLTQLAEQSLPVAKADFAQLQAFCQREYGVADLQAWDVPYYSEKLQQQEYAFDQEQLRPYFPADKVIEGLLKVTSQLFGIDFAEQHEFDRYHEDVKLYSVLQDGEVIAQFYFDLYARSGKRGGAWMADCRARRRAADGSLQLPVAFLTCNFTSPTADTPSLLTHNEVTTLFHEFGHGLHHMLTQVEVAAVSGISGVAWDAVELPSQFLENWCWEPTVIPMISGHYQTGEALPQAELEKMLAAKNFQSGMQMVRQIEFALFDMSIHQCDGTVDIQAELNAVRAKVAVIPAAEFNRFQHGFSHIFAGGYCAGYFSYKWAEVLSADAFSLFEEKGIFDQATGQQFQQTVLQRGGSEDAMAIFVAFRGRKPETAALLRHSGIC